MDLAFSTNVPLILLAALVATGSPGPAVLAIAGTSMASGRRKGLALASGVSAGSLTWSVAAALGLSAMMTANAWIFEVGRYLAAAYLAFLAIRSARSALRPKHVHTTAFAGGHRALFGKGLALHLTNPKAILFFGSLYTLGVPHDAAPVELAVVIVAVGIQSALVFHGYAWLFSTPAMTRHFIRLRRWFEAAFAVAFGAASLKVLTARLV